ncbi:GNAT family N-acetyltransferase [Streptomyces sp. NPDC007088]|uniref:GNAT family N-acetyltransferase n=1 Tax=Streptomyces sp. NPDC007088 TaxID=3364773 RepID=UPI003677FBB5
MTADLADAAGHHEDGEVVVGRWPGEGGRAQEGPAALLLAYHLRTETEKGAEVSDADGLPERYRREVLGPEKAFERDTVLVASTGGRPVGCLVATAPVGGRSEIKRLWTEPSLRGQGIATRLIEAGLATCADAGAGTVRLSVWQWRAGAVALYERLGFAVVESWDEREQLICMERTTGDVVS